MMTAGLILFAISGGLGALSWYLVKKLAGKHREISDLKRQNDNLRAAIKDRDVAMAQIQEAYKDADKKKKSIRTGDSAADFKRSLELVRDVPSESGSD